MRLSTHPHCNPSCNACHYKDLDYEQQLSRKDGWAKRNLAAWAEALRPILPASAAERLGYRTKTWLRSSFENGKLSFGMYRAAKAGGKWKPEFVSWDTCPLHAEAITEMIARLKTVLLTEAPGFSAQSLFGVWMGSPHVVMVGKELPSGFPAIDWSGILVPPFNRLWFHRANQVGRKIFQSEKFDRLAGSETSADDERPILAFRQMAHGLLEDARKQACSHLLAASPSLVVDLYCGAGDLSRMLPPEVGWLGVEASESAAAHANRLRDRPGVPHQAYPGNVEQRLRDPRLLNQIVGPYSLYLNPPRSGLSEEAKDRILTLIRRSPPTALVILSCSVSSLARDLLPFETSGFRVKRLQPYDFFPQTEHFETLGILVRR